MNPQSKTNQEKIYKTQIVNIKKEIENITIYPTNIKHVTRAIMNNYMPIIWYFR